MGERSTQFANGVVLPVANTVLLVATASTVQNASLAALPSLDLPGARAVRVRGSVVVTAATGGIVTVNVYRGNSTAGVLLGTFVSPGVSAIGTVVPFELVDTAPAQTLQYAISESSVTSAGTGNVIAETEAVN
jgi:hypothetical protein